MAHIDKSTRHFRRLRHGFLQKSLELAGDAKKHNAAADSESPNFCFDEAYNKREQVEKFGHRSREDIAAQAAKEYKEATDNFVAACKHCEFYPCRLEAGEDFSLSGVQEAFRGRRREIFSYYYEDKAARGRINSRLQQTDIGDGAKTAPCLVLARSGKIKKSDWILDG